MEIVKGDSEMTLKELKENREKLIKQNQEEYATRGNTQRCQELWAAIEYIDKEIERRTRCS